MYDGKSPGGLSGGESTCNAGDTSLILGGRLPGGEHGNPLLVALF